MIVEEVKGISESNYCTHLEAYGRKGIDITVGCNLRNPLILYQCEDKLWRHPSRRSREERRSSDHVWHRFRQILEDFRQPKVSDDRLSVPVDENIALESISCQTVDAQLFLEEILTPLRSPCTTGGLTL